MVVAGRVSIRGALALFGRAGSRGHVSAMFALGAMDCGGHEVPTDRIIAQRWFRSAAERGHAYAQMMLGRYLARGLASERDIHQARMWWSGRLGRGLAEANGDLATLPRPSAPLSTRNPG
jgi:TPR repeat protein